jgi:hypothetical protein
MAVYVDDAKIPFRGMRMRGQAEPYAQEELE